MATQIVSERPFWNLSGTYVLSPQTRALEATNDACCFLQAIEATIRTVIDGLEGDDGTGGSLASAPDQVAAVLYGVQYQVQMVRNLVGLPDAQSGENHGH